MYKSKILDKVEEFGKKRQQVINEKRKELQDKQTKLKDLEYNFLLAEQDYLVDLDNKKEQALEEMKPDVHSLRREVSDLRRQVKTLEENKYSLTDDEFETIKNEYDNHCGKEYEKFHHEMEEMAQQYKDKITQLVNTHIENKKARTIIRNKIEENCIKEDGRKARRDLKPMGNVSVNHRVFVDQVKDAYNKAYTKIPFSGADSF